MAGEPESSSNAIDARDKELMKMSESDPYKRQIFLCYKSRETWPPRAEDFRSDTLPKLFANALTNNMNDITVKSHVTICEGGDDVIFSDGDVLIFPEMIIYRGLKDLNVETFVRDVLVDGNHWLSGGQEELAGSFVFVCAQNNLNLKCGVRGPVLIENFEEMIEFKGLKNQVHVTACCHLGGDTDEGDMVIFTANSEGRCVGNWYGDVTPDDVVELLEKQIGKNETIDRIWRSKIGISRLGASKLDQLELPNESVSTEEPPGGSNSGQDLDIGNISHEEVAEDNTSQGGNGANVVDNENQPQVAEDNSSQGGYGANVNNNENRTQVAEDNTSQGCNGANVDDHENQPQVAEDNTSQGGNGAPTDENVVEKPVEKGLGRLVLITVATVIAIASVAVAIRRAR